MCVWTDNSGLFNVVVVVVVVYIFFNTVVTFSIYSFAFIFALLFVL